MFLWRDWQPLYRVGCEVLICLCMYEVTRAWSPTGLIPWFSKTEGSTYATLLHHPFLFKEKPTQCSRGSKKDLWRCCRGGWAISGTVLGESTQKSTYQVPVTNSYPSHYIIFHLPLVFLSPTSPLPFYSPSLSLSILPLFLYLPLFVRLLFVCLCVSLLACHDGSR